MHQFIVRPVPLLKMTLLSLNIRSFIYSKHTFSLFISGKALCWALSPMLRAWSQPWKWTNFYWACHYPLWESRRSWSMSLLGVILCLGHGSTLVLAQHLPVGPFGLQCCNVCVCWSTHSAMLLGSRTVAWSPVGLPCYSKGGPGAATSTGSLTEMPNLWPHPDFLKVRVCSIIKPPCGFTHTNLKHKEKSRLDSHWESTMCKAVR